MTDRSDDHDDDTPDTGRRSLLIRLGLAAGAAYVAPAMLQFDAAHASGRSGPSRRARGGQTRRRVSAPSVRRGRRRAAPSIPSGRRNRRGAVMKPVKRPNRAALRRRYIASGKQRRPAGSIWLR